MSAVLDSANASMVGASILQGPHQGAQKSIMHSLSLFSIWSKVALVICFAIFITSFFARCAYGNILIYLPAPVNRKGL
jgi:hypothetical protein